MEFFKLLLEPIVLEPVKTNIEKLNGWRFNSLKSVHQLINFADNYHKSNYHTRAIISCGFYIFYSILQCRNITANLCTKQGNLGLESAVHNQGRVIMARVWYVILNTCCAFSFP
jgi:hypothetical protein